MEFRNRLPYTGRKDSRSTVNCRFYAGGECRNGSSCPYLHAGESQKAASARASIARSFSHSRDDTAQPNSRNNDPCHFFLRGTCLKNEKCSFAHVNPKDVAQAIVRAEESPRSEDWRRELRGALVNFEDGAGVTKVNFPSDYSAAHISNLPQDVTVGYVVDYLASLGFSVPGDCIRLHKIPGKTYWDADVRVEDPQLAKQLCKELAKEGNGVKGMVVDCPMPHTTNHRRVDSRKVYCSWHKPTQTAWLNFGNEDIATKIGAKFERGICNVSGQRVKCEGPTRGAGIRNPLAWTIKLSDVPKDAKEKDVLSKIPPGMAPRHVELSSPTYNTDLSTATALVKSLMLQAGPLDWWESKVETAGKRFKAQARFMNDADARQAVNMYNNKPLPFASNSRLTVQLVYSAKFKVSSRIYDAVERELANHKRAWNSQHLVYIEYPPAQGLRVLKIEGEVRENVVSAKAILERVLGGEVVMRGGRALWTTSFAANGKVYQGIKELERDLGIVIARDKRKCQLRLLGSQSQCKVAYAALIQLAEDDSSSVFAVELNAEQFSWAFKGGYRAVAAAIGGHKVTLDIVSNPRRIIVTGSEADYNAVQAIIKGGEGAARTQPEASSVKDCAICFTEAETPVYTQCGHVYCAGCFQDLCFFGVDSGPSIRCQGDASECGKRLPLAELQENLSSGVLEDILEAAFTTYVNRHPNELRYCPTPDCGQIYRAADSSGSKETSTTTDRRPFFTCSECMVSICTACHNSHDGMTCAEHRDHGPGGYKAFQKTKKELGIKDCPKCGTMIEKTEGCDHMTCKGCGAHICWKCLKTFPKAEQVYPHMTSAHGSIGL